MKNQLVRAYAFTRFTSRLVTLVLFTALLSAAPFQAALAQTAPDLGDASTFAVLGGTAVTLTGSAVIGDLGSPTAVTVTGGTVAGTVYPATDPIWSLSVTPYDDFLTAYTALANATAYPCTGSLLAAYTGTGDALTLTPDVYCNEAAVTFTGTTLTLDAEGDPNAVWIFKIGTLGTGALTGTNFNVVFKDGVGDPCNVFWWVAGAATLTDSNFVGTILAGAAITTTRGTLNGQALAQAAVTITGTAVAVCSSTPLPPIPPDEGACEECQECSDYWNNYWNNYWYEYWKDNCKDYCRDYYKHCCKHHGKDCWKNCDNCKGKVTELTLQYQGASPALIRVEMKGKDGGIIFEKLVNPNEEFTINGQDKKGTLGTEITLYVNGVQNTKIHTSCSQPIGPGLVSGAFKVIEGYSKDGGLLATTGNDCWECKGKHHGKDKCWNSCCDDRDCDRDCDKHDDKKYNKKGR